MYIDLSVSSNTCKLTQTDTVSCSLDFRERRAHCALKNRMSECQRETGVVNGLLVARAPWLGVSRSILESEGGVRESGRAISDWRVEKAERGRERCIRHADKLKQ